MKLSIIIPAYNEEKTIQEILGRIIKIDFQKIGITDKEIILVDDGSTDKTIEKALETAPDINILRHKKNRGKGAALSSALSKITDGIVLIQDADLEYPPESYPSLLTPIINKDYAVVYGSRFLDEKHPQNMKTAYYLANRFETLLINKLYKVHMTDPMTCFKVFTISSLGSDKLDCRSFDADIEITAKILKKGLKIKEVSVPYKARSFSEGKKFHPFCSLKVLWITIKLFFKNQTAPEPYSAR